jgi:nitrate/TMAO reductase-like tetraheme cytochrome c subunit
VKDNSIQNQTFKDLSTECVSCHLNVHEDQFAINGETDCVRCHDTGNWFPDNFDHNATLFPLEGRHAEIECSACHKTLVKNGKTIVEYKIEKFECIDCHL